MKRKEFLKKSGLTTLAAIVSNKAVISSSADKSKVAIKVKPLGFPWETRDPFLFCAYHKDQFPKGNGKYGVSTLQKEGRNIGSDFVIKDGWRMYHGQDIPGFPYHPHRGFETITINKEGLVDHCDSLGGKGRFGEGDVQWMTAGKGIQHSEMFPMVNTETDNPLEIFQVWLNLPKKSKFVEPHFKMLWKDNIPQITYKDHKGYNTIIDVIAGNYNGNSAPSPTPNSWAANVQNEVQILTIKMDAYATWTIEKSSNDINRTIYFYDGESIVVGNKEVNVSYLIELDPTEEIKIINGSKTSKLLVLQGKPIEEPVVQHGPFVMNTQQEIRDAFQDYNETQFGGWPWDEKEITHQSKGRFALHRDGTLEER